MSKQQYTQASLFGSTLPKYSVIVEDPAWPERGGGKYKRGADRHYPLMSVHDIALLPVQWCAAADAHYFLWVTDNHLQDAFRVMSSRGFRYVRSWVWVKAKSADPLKLQLGLGQYGRNAHEYLLMGTRGRAEVPSSDRRPASVIVAPRLLHSQKPEAAWNVIETVCRPGLRLELNARVPRAGWDAVGHDLGLSIEQWLDRYNGL